MVYTLTAGAVRAGSNGLFASFGLADATGPNANHSTVTQAGVIRLNVMALGEMLGMNAAEMQMKFSVNDAIEEQLEEAAEAQRAICITWELPSAPGKVSQDKRGNLHYAFNIHIVSVELVDRWVDPDRMLDQAAMGAALAVPPVAQDPMVTLRARVANDRVRLAARAAIAPEAAPAAEDGDIVI